MGLLNDYLSAMTEIILDEEGTVDKFEGDAIMAFWGAPLDQPDQAARACRAALRQQAALKELNRQFAGLNLPPLSMRIGLNTGDAIVGNLGSAKALRLHGHRRHRQPGLPPGGRQQILRLPHHGQ